MATFNEAMVALHMEKVVSFIDPRFTRSNRTYWMSRGVLIRRQDEYDDKVVQKDSPEFSLKDVVSSDWHIHDFFIGM